MYTYICSPSSAGVVVGHGALVPEPPLCISRSRHSPPSLCRRNGWPWCIGSGATRMASWPSWHSRPSSASSMSTAERVAQKYSALRMDFMEHLPLLRALRAQITR